MTVPNTNLKKVITRFNIQNRLLARELNVDPSLVSRWLSGSRQLKASSETLAGLADYILDHCRGQEDENWLNAEFHNAGLHAVSTSRSEMCRNLILLIASDGPKISRSLLPDKPDFGGTTMICDENEITAIAALSDSVSNMRFGISVGFENIALTLEKAFEKSQAHMTLYIYLSNENVEMMLNDAIQSLLLREFTSRKVDSQLLFSLSSNTFAIASLINAYMRPIINGSLHISVVHGMTQAISNQTMFLFPGKQAILITDLSSAAVTPIATVINDFHFVMEISKNFERSQRYAQPILSLLNDKFGKNIIEIYYIEYCKSGNLDVIKDSINPMFMTVEGYAGVLRALGNRGEALEWRKAEYQKFNQDFITNLESGTVFREIISLQRLQKIAEDGFCMMPGQYFMDKNIVKTDTAACVDMLEGYIRFLEERTNFHLLILDRLRILEENSCWHLKQNHHMAINSWEDIEPTMIYSDQMMITYEFQRKFNDLWLKESVASGGKEGTIHTLRKIISLLQIHGQ